MGKFLFAVFAAVASLVLVESLVCNKCYISVFGICWGFNETCPTNSSVCYTERLDFPFLPSFMGFNSQGCTDNVTECDTISNVSLIGLTYETKMACCSEDNCNPITLSGAQTT
ncbi:hypothetical protein GOODEAATRI_008077 [Goodea atripinnis]|uniref:UPAR/Ly6 domain-containing protein n=1 Tax=Goodea atripinnis TaxID=208336 RepID=A0ABV0MQB0_9TELE